MAEIKVEELRVREHCQILFEVEAVLLVGDFLGRRNSIQIGDVFRHVRAGATAVARHRSSDADAGGRGDTKVVESR